MKRASLTALANTLVAQVARVADGRGGAHCVVALASAVIAIAIAPHFRRSARREVAIFVEKMRRWTPNSIRRSSCCSKSAFDPIDSCAFQTASQRIAQMRVPSPVHHVAVN